MEIKPEDSLIEYPCVFPIKVMGKAVPEFEDVLIEVVLEHDPDYDRDTLVSRPSEKGNYTGLTFHVNAVSREQLDALYKALHGHPLVSIVL